MSPGVKFTWKPFLLSSFVIERSMSTERNGTPSLWGCRYLQHLQFPRVILVSYCHIQECRLTCCPSWKRLKALCVYSHFLQTEEFSCGCDFDLWVIRSYFKNVPATCYPVNLDLFIFYIHFMTQEHKAWNHVHTWTCIQINKNLWSYWWTHIKEELKVGLAMQSSPKFQSINTSSDSMCVLYTHVLPGLPFKHMLCLEIKVVP